MYDINGSSKDSNYGINGSINFTMEISENNQPPIEHLVFYYNANVPSMLYMIEYAGYGLQGTITDAVSGEPVAAVIKVDDLMPIYSDPEVGDYHKFLLGERYTVTIEANGYHSQTIEDVDVYDNDTAILNVALQPQSGHFAYKFASSRIPDNNPDDEGNTKAALGKPDSINYSIGKNGWVVLDMQIPFLDYEGNDIIVFEGDDSPEDYSCYVSETMDGPWELLGEGSGTSYFDLSQSSLEQAQFVKIVDDGDGLQNQDDAGFDLDAVEIIDHFVGNLSQLLIEPEFLISPNPVKDQLEISFLINDAADISVEIIDISGKIVFKNLTYSAKPGVNKIDLNVEYLLNGIYLVKINSCNKNYYQKIIRQ